MYGFEVARGFQDDVASDLISPGTRRSGYRGAITRRHDLRVLEARLDDSDLGVLVSNQERRHAAGCREGADMGRSGRPALRPSRLRVGQVRSAEHNASNHTYAEGSLSQSLPDWIASHIRAFSFFAVVARQMVSDNLRAGIIPWARRKFNRCVTKPKGREVGLTGFAAQIDRLARRFFSADCANART